MRGMIVWLFLLLFGSGCVKKADRIEASSTQNETLMQEIYTQALEASKDNNPMRSIYLHTKNCEMGYSKSCNRVAYQHYSGEILTQNYSKALELYDKSCKMKNKYGCFNLANMLRLGEGTKAREVSLAFKLYKNNCSNECYRSCFNLAVMYYLGDATPKDKKLARKYFKKSCHSGMEIACENYIGVKYNKIHYIQSDDTNQ